MADKPKGRPGRIPRKVAGAGPASPESGALTLSEVAVRTGISMPTLQRYKKLYQSRIPSTGKGRTQRYPAEALAVFEELKRENIGRRGRPRKEPSAAVPERRVGRPARGRKPRAAETGDNYLTLTAIAEQTGISYPTLVRYSKLHAGNLPSRGTGRARRYAPEAVEVFRRLRSESPRGRRPKSAEAAPRPAARVGRIAVSGGGDAGVLARLTAIERAQEALDKQLKKLVELVSKPVRITIDRR